MPTNKLAESIAARLSKAGIDNHCMVGRENKATYNPSEPLVKVLSIYSSKGLGFDTVVLAGIDRIQYIAEDLVDQVRLMYVGMTHAKSSC